MKKVSEIRIDLGNIPGALTSKIPPELGKKGDKEALPIHSPADESTSENREDFREKPKSESVNGTYEPVPYFELPPKIEQEGLQNILSDESGEDLKKAVKLYGTDAHGWYVSFHYIGPQWGIYIPKSQILKFAALVFGQMNCSPYKMVELAFRSIYRHELCHFFVDYSISQIELIAEEHCYLKYKKLPYASHYEEQIANAWMLRGLKYPEKRLREPGALKYLRNYTKLQPAGYNEGYKIIDTAKFITAVEELSQNYAAGAKNGGKFIDTRSADLFNLYPFYVRDAWKYCPIHILNDTSEHGLPDFDVNLFPNIKYIRESNIFSKKLKKLHPKFQKAWEKVRLQLSISTHFQGLDFKKFPKAGKNVYSIRLGSSERVHLKYNPNDGSWFADDIGPHKAMGHG